MIFRIPADFYYLTTLVEESIGVDMSVVVVYSDGVCIIYLLSSIQLNTFLPKCYVGKRKERRTSLTTFHSNITL